MDSNNIDFKRSILKANEILISSTVINTFPFSITDLVKEIGKNKIDCCSFKRAAKYQYCGIQLQIQDFGSESAILQDLIIGKNKFSIIFYNQNHLNTRIRFSIAHELGHHILCHDKNNHEGYGKMEIETNFFAAQLLMPEQIIWELIRRGITINENKLVELFNVSKEAAKKRIETLRKRDQRFMTLEEKEQNDIILLKYKSFLDNIKPVYQNTNWYDDEYEMQKEREKWF